MVCDARTETPYDPLFEIRCVTVIGLRTTSAFLNDIYIAELLKILLKRVRYEFAVKVHSRITRLNTPVTSHNRSDKMVDISVRRVKRMTSDVEYAAADFEGATQSANLTFALDYPFLARIVTRQSQTCRAGAND